VQLFIAMHDEQIIQHTKPYHNVIEVLKELHNNNIPMALATNKRLAPTQKLIDHFSWNDYFELIECSDNRNKNRDKKIMIQDIINNKKKFCNSYFVGDTRNDGICANLNNLKFVLATYGYGKKENWDEVIIYRKIDNFKEILYLN
jgi:phosphoglycolate phosphatase